MFDLVFIFLNLGHVLKPGTPECLHIAITVPDFKTVGTQLHPPTHTHTFYIRVIKR